MTDKHTYDYEIDLKSGAAPARVVRMVGQNKRVLEIGAGPGSITKHLTHTNQCDVTALEIDPAAIEILKPHCSKVVIANLNDAEWTSHFASAPLFDVVVAADVLEHVQDPSLVIKQMKHLLAPEGSIILSLPHIGYSAIHACLFDEDFQQNDWGLLDKTHIRFFGIKNIQQLFEDAELDITEVEFVVYRPEQTEFAPVWTKTTANLRYELSKNPFGNVYQVVLRGQLSNPHNTKIQLQKLTPQKPDKRSLGSHLQSFVDRHLPKSIKLYLKNKFNLYQHTK